MGSRFESKQTFFRLPNTVCFSKKWPFLTPQVLKQIQTLLNLGCLVFWKRYKITKFFSFWWNTLYVGHNPGLSVSKDGIRHYGAAIIEVVSKVERDIRGGDLDSNMSHPTSTSFPYVLKMLSPRKICTIWAQHHNHNPENLSLERRICALLLLCRNRFFPIFLLT